MTTPAVTPSKAKMWWTLAGSVLSTLATIAPQIAGYLPPPWGPLLTGIVGLIGLIVTRRVHQAPYIPAGTVLTPVDPANPPDVNTTPAGGYPDPWKG